MAVVMSAGLECPTRERGGLFMGVEGQRGFSGILEGLPDKPASFLGRASGVADVLQQKDMCSEICEERMALQRTEKEHKLDNIGLSDIVYRSGGCLKGSVVSYSMEHKVDGRRIDFDLWWGLYGKFYEELGISAGQFLRFPFMDGLCVGDCIAVEERSPNEVEIGDALAFTLHDVQRGKGEGLQGSCRRVYIHRVIKKWKDGGSGCCFTTKGDRNLGVLSWEEIVPWTEVIGVGTGYCRRDSASHLGLPLHASTGGPTPSLPNDTVSGSDVSPVFTASSTTKSLTDSTSVVKMGESTLPRGGGVKKVGDRKVSEEQLTKARVDNIIGDLKSKDSGKVHSATQALASYLNVSGDGLRLEELEQACRLFYLAGVYNILYKNPEGELVSEFPDADVLLRKTMSLAKVLKCEKYDVMWRNLGAKYVGHASYLLLKNRLILMDLNRARLGGDLVYAEGHPWHEECTNLRNSIRDPEEKAKISVRLLLAAGDGNYLNFGAINKFVGEKVNGKGRTATEKLVMYASYCSALEDCLSYVNKDETPIYSRKDVVSIFNAVKVEMDELGGIYGGRVQQRTIDKFLVTSASLRGDTKIASLQTAWRDVSKVKKEALGAKGQVVKKELVENIYDRSVDYSGDGSKRLKSEDLRTVFEGFVEHHKNTDAQEGRGFLPSYQQVGLASGDEVEGSYQVFSSKPRGLKGFKQAVVEEIKKQAVSVQAWNAVYENFGSLSQGFNSIFKGMGTIGTLGFDLWGHAFLGPINVIFAVITFYTRGQTILGAAKTLKSIRKIDVEKGVLNKILKKIGSRSSQLQTLEILACIFNVLSRTGDYAHKDDIWKLKRIVNKVSKELPQIDSDNLKGLFSNTEEKFIPGFTETERADVLIKTFEYLRSFKFSDGHGDLSGSKFFIGNVDLNVGSEESIRDVNSIIERRLTSAVRSSGDASDVEKLDRSFAKVTGFINELEEGGVPADVIRKLKGDSMMSIVTALSHMAYSGGVVTNSILGGLGVTGATLVHGPTQAIGLLGTIVWTPLTLITLPIATFYYSWGTLVSSISAVRARATYKRLKAINAVGGAVEGIAARGPKDTVRDSITAKALERLQGKAGHVWFRHSADAGVFGAFSGFVAFWTVGATVALALSFIPPLAPFALVLGTVVGAIATAGFFTAGAFYYPSVFVETLAALRKNRKINLLQDVINGDAKAIVKYRKQRAARLEKKLVVTVKSYPVGEAVVNTPKEAGSLSKSARRKVISAYRESFATNLEIEKEKAADTESTLEEQRVLYQRNKEGYSREQAEVYDDHLEIAYLKSKQDIVDIAMIELVEISSRAALAHVFYEAKKAAIHHDGEKTVQRGKDIALVRKVVAGDSESMEIFRGKDDDEAYDNLSDVLLKEEAYSRLRILLNERREVPEVNILTQMLDSNLDLVDQVLDMESPRKAIKLIETFTGIHTH